MRISTLIVAIASLFHSFCVSEIITKPIIGIISTPSDFHDLYPPDEFSYIKGTYPELIEAADGIPLGIPWDLPDRELIKILDSINGVLFTGGDARLWELDASSNKLVLSNFTKRAGFILRYAIRLNDEGVHFPVYGICQGHEVIILGLTKDPHVIDYFVHPGQLDTVHVTSEGKQSRMFANMPEYVVNYLQDRRSMFYNHRFGFNRSLWEQDETVQNFFTITATGVDDNGKEFIAAMEAVNYPIYTVQYHPERVFFEWRNKDYFDHPDESALAVLIQANFFTAEALKNQQKFYSNDALSPFLINNHEQVYFNITWPRVHFYDKKSPLSYNINYSGYDQGDIEGYDCIHHDCSFIKDGLDA